MTVEESVILKCEQTSMSVCSVGQVCKGGRRGGEGGGVSASQSVCVLGRVAIA